MSVPSRPKILVVDDEEDMIVFLTTLLEDHGYATMTARDGAEAMTRVRAERPDLITLDVTMPAQSGVRTYRELKTDPALATIPVVIVTGISQDFQQFISSRKQVPPPDGYVSKPIDQQRFLTLVQQLLSRGR
jgi:CheY-like chemotaxis protein